MQEKQKVTLYIPPGLHRQLKVKAAVDAESMSAIMEKAIAFYLKHPELVEEKESTRHGKTHQVHICPECEAAMVMRDGGLISLRNQPGAIAEEFPVEVGSEVASEHQSQVKDKEKLVACYPS